MWARGVHCSRGKLYQCHNKPQPVELKEIGSGRIVLGVSSTVTGHVLF